MQYVAVGLFNFLGVAYAIVQILQLRAFKNCVENFESVITSTVLDSQDQYSKLFDAQRSWYGVASHGSYIDLVTMDPKNPGNFLKSGPKNLLIVSQDITNGVSLFDFYGPILISIAVIMCVGALLGLYFSYKSYQQTGWHVFMLQGADIRKKRNHL
jgi:hypothetical protein